MDRGHPLIITIFLVNAQLVSHGHGVDFIRSMNRDNRRPLCGEVGTPPTLIHPSSVKPDPLKFQHPPRGNIDLPQYLLIPGTAHELAC